MTHPDAPRSTSLTSGWIPKPVKLTPHPNSPHTFPHQISTLDFQYQPMTLKILSLHPSFLSDLLPGRAFLCILLFTCIYMQSHGFPFQLMCYNPIPVLFVQPVTEKPSGFGIMFIFYFIISLGYASYLALRMDSCSGFTMLLKSDAAVPGRVGNRLAGSLLTSSSVCRGAQPLLMTSPCWLF